MKYAIVIPDGCADEPQESLGGRTPLQAANTPAMDALAASGVVGRASHVPAHLPAGSAVANMSLLGNLALVLSLEGLFKSMTWLHHLLRDCQG